MQNIIHIFLTAHQELTKQQLSAQNHLDLAKNLSGKLIEFNFKEQQFYFQVVKKQDDSVAFELTPTSYIFEDSIVEDDGVDAPPPILKLSKNPDLKITFTPPKNTSLSYDGEDAWMNWLRIEGDIATAKHLQNHFKQLKLDQAEIVNAFVNPLLQPILGDHTLVLTQKINQGLMSFMNAGRDLKSNTLHFLTQERPVLVTQEAFQTQQTQLYHLNNDTDRLAQKIDYLTQLLASVSHR